MDEEARLRELEKRVSAMETEQILAKNNAGYAKEKVDELTKKIDNLQAGVHRLVLTAGGLFLVAIINFIIKGGLAGAGI